MFLHYILFFLFFKAKKGNNLKYCKNKLKVFENGVINVRLT